MSNRRNPLFWMRLYVADFLAATQDLTPAQLGAYVRLLFTMWIHAGELPSDEKSIQRITRVDNRNWPSVWGAIRGLFKQSGEDKLTDDDLRADYFTAKAKLEAKKAGGSLGGQTTQWHKRERKNPHAAPRTQRMAPEAANPLESNDVGQANAQQSRVEYLRTKEEEGEASPSPRNSRASASPEKEEGAFSEEVGISSPPNTNVLPFPEGQKTEEDDRPTKDDLERRLGRQINWRCK